MEKDRYRETHVECWREKERKPLLGVSSFFTPLGMGKVGVVNLDNCMYLALVTLIRGVAFCVVL